MSYGYGNHRVADPYTTTRTCKSCNKEYIQFVEDQMAGFREMSYDECPYCGNINGQSMHEEYTNRKMEK